MPQVRARPLGANLGFRSQLEAGRYNDTMRVALAGGGTGGHVIPALAIAQELKKSHSAELLFIGTPRGMENRLVPAAGFELRLVQVGALKNVSLATRFKTRLTCIARQWPRSQGVGTAS